MRIILGSLLTGAGVAAGEAIALTGPPTWGRFGIAVLTGMVISMAGVFILVSGLVRRWTRKAKERGYW